MSCHIRQLGDFLDRESVQEGVDLLANRAKDRRRLELGQYLEDDVR